MIDTRLIIQQSGPLSGVVSLAGAKNATLVTIASLILTEGKSRLRNVPVSQDVFHMIDLLVELGARATFHENENVLDVDTSTMDGYTVSHDIMKKTRASILAMGPLLARFGRADLALPGGDAIGARPINYHLNNFIKMGVDISHQGEFLYARAAQLRAGKLLLEYPSVGATENIMMAAALTPGVTRIINAALEPEVLDLIEALKKMGALITILPPATIEITGVGSLSPIDHTIMSDRIEAGTLLLAAAVTGGRVTVVNARADHLDLFLAKLEEMGHEIIVGIHDVGITIKATLTPKAVSFKTVPYPGFPTDLQAPMLVAQCRASGTAVVEETVFENRFHHVLELQKMGALIEIWHNKAWITGVPQLHGARVVAQDIRAASALVLAGLIAHGTTTLEGVYHLRRGYENFEHKLITLGGNIAEQQEVLQVRNVTDPRPYSSTVRDQI